MKLKLYKPLKNMIVTQPHNVNFVYRGFYRRLGFPDDLHKGNDYRAPDGTEYFAVFDGQITSFKWSRTGGWMLYLTNEDGYTARYLHLQKKLFISVGDYVKAGDKIGLTNNSGTGSKGAHLHFDLKDKDRKWVDPMPYLVEGWDKLPVDDFYGRLRDWKAEWLFRFAPEAAIKAGDKIARAGHWVHRQLLKRGERLPLSGRQTNAVLYGGWSFREVMDPTMYPIWAFLKKVEYQQGKKPPIRLVYAGGGEGGGFEI